DDPIRERLLAQIADEDARQILAQAYHRYRNLSPAQIPVRLLGRHARSPRHLAILFYAWHIGDASDSSDAVRKNVNASALASWLQNQIGAVTSAEVRRLEHAYGNPRLTIADFGYLLSRQPLGLWCAGELARNPQIGWDELLARSAAARDVASAWLFKTRNRKAQDLRLRIRIERDAFAQMTPSWRKLGFAFDELVPSYATAIGSSADRPMALAELMGIIVNDGYRRPTIEVRRLGFGLGTPYHTVFETGRVEGEPVMRASIAGLLREVLAEVVERGTARRVRHAFVDDTGAPIRIGGKTGSGDNRIEAFRRGGQLLSAHAVSRTAGFVFYVGDRVFGVITASVSGPQAASYSFTSALPLAILKLLAPTLNEAARGWKAAVGAPPLRVDREIAHAAAALTGSSRYIAAAVAALRLPVVLGTVGILPRLRTSPPGSATATRATIMPNGCALLGRQFGRNVARESTQKSTHSLRLGGIVRGASLFAQLDIAAHEGYI
ncbi:MAG: hypothetical protein ACRETD_06770, partial [Steroidobacteraceae bacterium]